MKTESNVRALTAEELQLVSGGYDSSDIRSYEAFTFYDDQDFAVTTTKEDETRNWYASHPDAPQYNGPMQVDWTGVAIDLLSTAAQAGSLMVGGVPTAAEYTAKEIATYQAGTVAGTLSGVQSAKSK